MLNETRWFTRRMLRNFLFVLLPSLVLTLLGSLVSPQQPLAQTEADPGKLPAAAHQVPDWDAYGSIAGVGVRLAPANTRYLDPKTGVPVTKISFGTDFPEVGTTNTDARVEYSEGGPYISREWGNGQHTILIRVVIGSIGIPYLGDYQRGGGVTNWRRFSGYPGSYPRFEQTSVFSSDPLTPRILYYVDNGKLYRYNTAANALEAGDNIPLGGLTVMTGGYLGWMQSSKDNDWIVFQWNTDSCTPCPGAQCQDVCSTCPWPKVFAYNKAGNGQLRSRDAPCMNEPHMDRDGRYLLIMDGGAGECGQGQQFELFWHLWDLSTDPGVVTCRGPVYSGHIGWARGLFAAANGNETANRDFYYTAATDLLTYTKPYADPNAFQPDHRAGQWVQNRTDAGQWYWGSNYDDGEATVESDPYCPNALGWSPVLPPACGQNCGKIFTGAICWNPTYQKPTIGIKAVYQTAAEEGDSNRLGHTLSQAGSVASMTEGTFFYDGGDPQVIGDEQLYVWARHDGIPTGRVRLAAPTPVHRGVGAQRHDGSEVRLLCHDYAWKDDRHESSADYYDTPFATTSPDGKLVMFASNMGKKDGRRDVFIAEVPLSTTNVVWTNVMNAVANGNSLQETCGGCGNAGAQSSQSIASGDGSMEFTAIETTTSRAAGLSVGNTDNTIADIDFAIVAWDIDAGDGHILEVREKGVYKWETRYFPNDRFRIAVESGVVRYYKYVNGTPSLIYTSTVPPTYPLLVDTALGTNAIIANAVIAGAQ